MHKDPIAAPRQGLRCDPRSFNRTPPSKYGLAPPLTPGSELYNELVAEGRIKPYALDHERVHFTEAYDRDLRHFARPAEEQEIYAEINDRFTHHQRRPGGF